MSGFVGGRENKKMLKKKWEKLLGLHNPDIVEKYENLYKDSYLPNDNYTSKTNSILGELCNKYNLDNTIL